MDMKQTTIVTSLAAMGLLAFWLLHFGIPFKSHPWWWAAGPNPRNCHVLSLNNPTGPGFGTFKVMGQYVVLTDYHPTNYLDLRRSHCIETDGPKGSKWVRQEFTDWHVLAQGCNPNTLVCDMTGVRICYAPGLDAGDCSTMKTGPGGCAVCKITWFPE